MWALAGRRRPRRGEHLRRRGAQILDLDLVPLIDGLLQRVRHLTSGAKAAAAVLTVLVLPAVAVRSSSSTTAMVYDLQVGTSICDRHIHSRKHVMASSGEGASGTRISRRLEGRWVDTIVFNNPMRLARRPTPRYDKPENTLTQKNLTASVRWIDPSGD